MITIGLFAYFTIRAGSTFTDSLSLSSAAGYAGPIAAIAVGEVLLLVLAEIDLSAGQVFLFARGSCTGCTTSACPSPSRS